MTAKLLRELEGRDIPLLTRCQLTFLEDFESVVNNEFLLGDLNCEPHDEKKTAEFMKKVSLIEENLKIIINQLKGGRSAREKFLKTYPKWKKVRENGIEKLRGISLSIHSDRRKCNVSKLVGYGTSFAGGGITLASAILIPFTFGLTTPLAILGGSMTAAGCTTAIGTSVAEIVLLKKKVKVAQDVIEEDKKYFQEMNNWLEHAAKLEEALSEILEIDIIKDIFESVQSLVENGMKIRNDFERLNYLTKSINSLKTLFPLSITEAVPLIGIVTVIAVLVTIFLLMLNIENRFVFDCASLTIRSIVGIASLTENAFNAARLTSFFTGNAILAKDLAKAVTRGAVAVLGMGLDIAAIVLTSIDVHKGSLSPQATEISTAADDLEKEAKLLQNVYENLNKYN